MKKALVEIDPERLRGRTVVVRADLNTPVEAGQITDDQRVRASLPTLRLLRDAGARVVLLSHLGRPKGEVKPEFSLRPVAARMAELLGSPVVFVPENRGAPAAAAVRGLTDGGVALFENTRFDPGDTDNDPVLAGEWASLGDLFVNDAFGTAHRAHASTAGLAVAMVENGGEAVAGLLMAKELRFLEEALRSPERPFVAILGGAKISGKIDVISALLPRVDRLLIGGAMANTFFRAMGLGTGRSLVEDERLETARGLLAEAGETLVLPVDCVVGASLDPGVETRAVARAEVSAGDVIGDIGPESRRMYGEIVRRARTIVWNGPMGVFEHESFAEGTVQVALALAEACDAGSLGIIGGGDSAAAAKTAGVVDRITHVSTGGGASLELLAGAQLPGVTSLTEGE